MTIDRRFVPGNRAEAANDNHEGFHIPGMDKITNAAKGSLQRLTAANDNTEIQSVDVKEYTYEVATNVSHILLDEAGVIAQAA